MEQKFIDILEKQEENYITIRSLCNLIHSTFDAEEVDIICKIVVDPNFLYYLQQYPGLSNSERKNGLFSEKINTNTLKEFYNLDILFDDSYTFNIEDLKKLKKAKYRFHASNFSRFKGDANSIDIDLLKQLKIIDVYTLVNEYFNTEEQIKILFPLLGAKEKLKLVNSNEIAYKIYEKELAKIICEVILYYFTDGVLNLLDEYYSDYFTFEDATITLLRIKEDYNAIFKYDALDFTKLVQRLVVQQLTDIEIIGIINYVYKHNKEISNSNDFKQLIKTNTKLLKLDLDLRIKLLGAKYVLENELYKSMDLKTLITKDNINYIDEDSRKYYFKNVTLTNEIIDEYIVDNYINEILSNKSLSKDSLYALINKISGELNISRIKFTFDTNDLKHQSEKVVRCIVNQKFGLNQLEALDPSFNFSLIDFELVLKSRKVMNNYIINGKTKEIAKIDTKILVSLPNFSTKIAEELINYDKRYVIQLLDNGYNKQKVYDKYLIDIDLEKYNHLFGNVSLTLDSIIKLYHKDKNESLKVLDDFLKEDYAYSQVYFNYNIASDLLEDILVDFGAQSTMYEKLSKIVKQIYMPQNNCKSITEEVVSKEPLNYNITILKEEGMIFDGKCNELSASNYINYNTTWGMLQRSTKQFSMYMRGNSIDTPYSGITFYEVIQAGLLDYYYNDFLSVIIKEFEHSLKVLMNRIYSSLEQEEMEYIDYHVSYYNFSFRDSLYNTERQYYVLEDIFNYATLYELIDIFTIYFYDKQKVITISFDKAIASFIRNKVYHHDVALNGEFKDTYYEYKDVIEEMDQIPFTFTAKETDYLMKNKQENYCYLAVKLVLVTSQMLKAHPNLDYRRASFFNKIEDNFKKCQTTLTKTNKYDDWVYTHFNILNITLEKAKTIYK